MRRFYLDTIETEVNSGNSVSNIKSGETFEGYPHIDITGSTPVDTNITSWMDIVGQELTIRPDAAHVYTFIPDTVVTTTTSTTSSSSSSSSSTISTTSSTISSTSSSSTISTTSTISTISTTSSSSSTISTTSTISTISTTSSSSSTISSTSTISTISTTSSTISSTSTISTTSTISSSSSTISSTSTISTISTTSSSSSSTTTTYWCYYNEVFNDLDLWDFYKKHGGETATIVAGKMHLDIPNSLDTQIIGEYQYLLSTGDFDIRINVSNYTPDYGDEGFYTALRIVDSTDPTVDWTWVMLQQIDNIDPFRVHGNSRINTVTQSETEVELASPPTGFRLTRIGTVVAMYYETGGSWVKLKEDDFGGRANNLTSIRLYAYDDITYGGSVEFDNLMFFEGCPDGYPKAWTTTTSTTTTTTTV